MFEIVWKRCLTTLFKEKIKDLLVLTFNLNSLKKLLPIVSLAFIRNYEKKCPAGILLKTFTTFKLVQKDKKNTYDPFYSGFYELSSFINGYSIRSKCKKMMKILVQ